MIVQSKEGKLSDLLRDLKKLLLKLSYKKFKPNQKAEENGCWNGLN